MKQLAKEDKVFAENPMLTVTERDDGDGYKIMELVWQHGRIKFTLLPEAFGFNTDDSRGLIYAAANMGDIKLKAGDTIKFSPGYLTGKTDEVFIVSAEKMGEGVFYSRGKSSIGKAFAPPQAIKYLAEQMVIGAKRKPVIDVRPTAADMPFKAVDGMIARYKNGTIYIVADKIGSPEELRAAVFHELVGHFGLRGFFGSFLNDALTDIHDNNPLIRKYAKEWRADNADIISDYNLNSYEAHYLSVEEAMSRLSEEGKSFSMADRLLVLVQKLLRTIGMRNLADSLENAQAPTEERVKAATQVADILKRDHSPEAAQNFITHATDAIGDVETTGSQPYGLDLSDPSLLLPKPDKPELNKKSRDDFTRIKSDQYGYRRRIKPEI